MSLGVDTENLIVSQPDNGEQALEIFEALVKPVVVESNDNQNEIENQ